MSQIQPTYPKVSIVIPCRNERGAVERLLRNVMCLDGRQLFEVIVADGLSDDGTADILSSLQREYHDKLRVITNPGRTASAGLNLAILAARGEIILRMDVHTSYSKDYVTESLRVLESTGAQNVGGPWRAVGVGLVGEAIAASFSSRLSTGGGAAHDHAYEGPADTVYLGCWRRSLFQSIGPFDEALVRNQDDEFNLRILRSGGRVWQSPSIRSEYRCRSTLRDLIRQFYQYGYWKVAVIRKHRMLAAWRHVAPVIALMVGAAVALAAAISETASFIALGLATAYAVTVMGESVRIASKSRWPLLPALIAVFPSYHFGYAIGSLNGVIDFWLLRRQPRESATVLSRSTVSQEDSCLPE